MLEARRGEIVSLVQRYGEVPVAELSKLLHVSEVTIRSDLKALEQSGQVRRTRGGVRLPLGNQGETPLEEAGRQHAHAKRRIGQAAAALVQDRETVFLDVGSTTTEVARHLSPTLRGVTVVTAGINIALELERLPNLRVIVTGGTLRPLQHSLVSPYALEVLRHIHADRLFLGCNGVDAIHGVTNANHEEAEVKRCMVAHAAQVIVVADHSKLGEVSRAHLTPLSRVSALITDRHGDGLPPALGQVLRDVQTV
nr:DeoR/GlpR family DNA-binding transcription regulator [Deinococcus hopiensis]